MSLRFKYILFIVIIHSVLILVIYQLLEENKWLFLGSEILVLFSLILSYQLYKGFIKPIQLMQSGVDAIADADFSIKYTKTGSVEINNLIETYNQMIDQLREERTLMTGQSYFIQNLIEVTPLGIIIMDYDGKISNLNPSAAKILGIKDNWTDKSLDQYSSEIIPRIQDIPNDTPTLIEVNGIDKYKVQINEVVHQGFKRKFILIDDLSTEMLKTQKEAFGKIIRMMAHEVNNSMGAVNSILDTVVEYGFDENDDPVLKESLEIARERNVGLGKFMANYASILRLPEPQMKKMDLASMLKKSGQLFMPKAKELDISIEFDIPKHPVTINGDKLLLEQVISNIIKNAIESIHEDGDIKISCTEYPITFTIADNGEGISDKITHKIFTPFFSTKPNGQGVGLMLIRDILTSHKTDFFLQTDPETKWTKFTVRF